MTVLSGAKSSPCTQMVGLWQRRMLLRGTEHFAMHNMYRPHCLSPWVRANDFIEYLLAQCCKRDTQTTLVRSTGTTC